MIRRVAVRRALAKLIPDARAEAVLKSNRTAGAGRAGGQLANVVLGHLPLGVAVIDADTRLLFWNEQAAGLFGMPPLMAAQMPFLKEVLAGIANLTPRQRDAIVAFCATHVAAGDRVEPENYLRISPGRRLRLVIQVRGIGSGRWMVVVDDGKLAVASARSGPAQDGGVAWIDALTGLSNRRHFNEVLRSLVEDASPEPRHSVLLIDLDWFTAINETFGHPVGDALLCLVARRLRREARSCGWAATSSSSCSLTAREPIGWRRALSRSYRARSLLKATSPTSVPVSASPDVPDRGRRPIT
jgi:hypothetical protein